MRTVAIALDGVLRKPLDVEAQDFGASLLYTGLAQGLRVVILGGYEPEKDKHFLAVNGLGRYTKIEPLREEDAPDEAGRIKAQIRRLRAEGFQFEFVVLPDPDLALEVYKMGVPVLLYLHPIYSAESFRPDYTGGIRPWADLTAEVAYSRGVQAKKMQEREDA